MKHVLTTIFLFIAIASFSLSEDVQILQEAKKMVLTKGGIGITNVQKIDKITEIENKINSISQYSSNSTKDALASCSIQLAVIKQELQDKVNTTKPSTSRISINPVATKNTRTTTTPVKLNINITSSTPAPSTSKSKSKSNTTYSSDKVYVKGYYKKDGTYVAPHYRNKKRK